MNILITLLIYILIFSVVWFLMTYILGLLSVQQPLVNIIKAIFLIVVLIIILGVFWGGNFFLELPRIR